MKMVDLPQSVQILITRNDQEAAWDPEDGHLGSPKVGDRYQLDLLVPESEGDLSVLMVQGKDRKVVPARNKAAAADEGMRRFALKVEVKLGKDGLTPYIDHNSSRFTCLMLSGDGRYQMWSVGLLAQGELFVLQHPTFIGRCYSKDDKVVFPEMQREWPSLEEFVTGLLKGSTSSLLNVMNYAPPATPSIELPTEDWRATLQWFDPWLGYGVALLKDGTATRVHHKEVARRDGERLIYMKPGQRLSFKKINDSGDGGSLSRQLQKVRRI